MSDPLRDMAEDAYHEEMHGTSGVGILDMAFSLVMLLVFFSLVLAVGWVLGAVDEWLRKRKGRT